MTRTCEISKIKIECYFDNYNKLQHVIGEHADKLDWVYFTGDNFRLFDEKFIKEYNKKIIFYNINVNTPEFQKNFKAYESVDGYNLDNITAIYDYGFFEANRDKLKPEIIISFNFNHSDEEFEKHKDFYSKLNYQCFTRTITKARFYTFDKEVINRYKTMFMENGRFYDYHYFAECLNENENYLNFDMDTITDETFCKIYKRLTQEQINQVSDDYSYRLQRKPEFYKHLNLKYFSLVNRYILWRDEKIEFYRVLKG